MSDDGALEELRTLTRALHAHLDWQVVTGATGLERASAAPTPSAVSLALPTTSPGQRESPRRAEGTLARAPEPTSALRVLAETVRGCTLCALAKGRQQTVFARGTGSAGICFIGEAPGADEDAQGLPFVGAAGQLLDRMIEAMGLDRDEVYVCNVVKCRPPNNRKPEPEELSACAPYLSEQLELVAPQVIVALGASAVQGLFGLAELPQGITQLRGKWKSYRGQVDVMPTFHPAYLLRNPAAKREVWEDLQQVLRRLGRSLPARR